YVVLLGNGDGTFRKLPNQSVAMENIIAADVDGDGVLDLVGGNGIINFLHGNGDGTFSAAVITQTDTFVDGIATADLNGDGRLDLALSTENGLHVLFGNGNGTFQKAVKYGSGYLNSVIATDLNEDGHPDVAAAQAGGTAICVLLNNGDGTLGPQKEYGLVTSGWDIMAADFNRDGHVDLAITDSEYLSILAGRGDGSFQKAAKYGDNLGGAGGSRIAVGSFERNHLPDVAAAGSGVAKLLIQ
ncbi:MAG: VCBS repeat-containing protein, partial [Acidobacteriales bacterium]|nr:VCBS repeat-containing protein [Terriglobales bacterium]